MGANNWIKVSFIYYWMIFYLNYSDDFPNVCTCMSATVSDLC